MAEPEALRLADALEGKATAPRTREEAAAELRRLHSEVERLGVDARRYHWLRNRTRGVRDSRGRMEFDMPDPHPLGNIMQGSVAQHFDAAIDAALDQMKDTP